MSALAEAIPAATLVVFRASGDAPELLVMERRADMAFAGGALVFPGGRVEPDDRLIADRIAPGRADAAERIAAIRETVEEVGLAVGFHATPDRGMLAELRRRLRSGRPLSSLLEAFGLRLDLDALTPFARWCPGHPGVRRFDTFFFLAETADIAELPEPDAQEAVRSFWASAGQILADAAAGKAKLIFPTRRNLERLAQYRSFEEAQSAALRHPVATITPFVDTRDGVRCLCIPEGLDYPVTAEPLDAAMRG